MTLETIKRFYAELEGWNMFDTQYLTCAVSEYLDHESEVLRQIFATESRYSHLVEVGCGYGRYMDWAVSSGIDYDGLDIVDWMINMGEIKAQQMKERFPNVHCAVHLHPAERLSQLMDRACTSKSEDKTIVFFPFNCFGNVSNAQEVMRSLYREGLDVVISTFKTDAKSTELRKQYYQNCGYSNLQCTLNKSGLLIESDEGFRAFAYSKDALLNMFAKNGYELVSYLEAAEIGAIYHFRPANLERSQKNLSRQGSRRYPRHEASLDASVYLLNDTDTTTGESARLLSFTKIEAVTKNVSVDGIALICESPWHTGIRARITLSTEPRINFIAVLTRCEALSCGRYLLAFKFFKPNPALIDRLFGVLSSLQEDRCG